MKFPGGEESQLELYMAAHKILKKSNFHYICFIEFAAVPKRGSEWQRARPSGLAPGQRSSEETSQRWRATLCSI